MTLLLAAAWSVLVATNPAGPWTTATNLSGATGYVRLAGPAGQSQSAGTVLTIYSNGTFRAGSNSGTLTTMLDTNSLTTAAKSLTNGAALALLLSLSAMGQSNITFYGTISFTPPSISYTYPAGTIFAGPTNVADGHGLAWTDEVALTSVSPSYGGTVALDQGTYLRTNSITLADGVTYIVGQDTGHNGTVTLNGSNYAAVAVSMGNFSVIDGSHYNDSLNHLVVTNYTDGGNPSSQGGGTSFYSNGQTNFTIRYVTAYDGAQFGVNASTTGILLSHDIFLPPYGKTYNTDNQSDLTFDWNPPYPTYNSYTSVAVIDSCSFTTFRDGGSAGYGDVGISYPSNTTITNTSFNTVVLPTYSSGKHQEAIQISGNSWLRVVNCFVTNQEYTGFFGGANDPYPACNIQYVNNQFGYTDYTITNGGSCFHIYFGGAGGVSQMTNITITGNSIPYANWGIIVGDQSSPYDVFTNFSGVLVSNKTCLANSRAGVSVVSTNAGPRTNAVVAVNNGGCSYVPNSSR
jgi:hypothetical protein